MLHFLHNILVLSFCTGVVLTLSITSTSYFLDIWTTLNEDDFSLKVTFSSNALNRLFLIIIVLN